MGVADDLDAIVASVDTALVVVTVAVGDERGGCLVGFHTQTSIDPRRYVLWLSVVNHTYALARRAEHLAVHFLTVADHDLAVLFGGTTEDRVDKFVRCHWRPGPGGVPLLDRCPNRLVVRPVAVVDGVGDHVGFVTEPIEGTSATPFAPLRLAAAHDIEPGHPAEGGEGSAAG